MDFRPYDQETFLVASRSGEGDHIVDINERTCSCEGFQIRKTCQHLTKLMSTEAPTEELQLAPVQPGEQPMKQLAPYDEFRTKIESLKKTAETITVTDISQTAEMKIARATRLSLKDIRVGITHRHKELKEHILVEGRKIDAGKNELLAILEPMELRLKDQEEFIERETARIQAERRVARIAELTPFLAAPLAVDLGVVADDHYAAMLQDAKDAHAARLAREQKEKEEAAAKLKAEAEERERIRLENERLKKEAEEREAALNAEREKAAAEKKAAEEKLAAERKAAEAQAAKIKKQAEEAARVAKEKADAEAKAAAEKARKEREEIEAKAKAEREAAAEVARKEREAAAAENARLAKIAEEIEAKRQEAYRKAAEEQAAELARIEAASLAPEKEKLIALAATVRGLALPSMTTEKGIAALAEIDEKVESFAKWIEKKAVAL